ncbi:MAG: hypothetical protein IPF92_23830 [Myxococcales bacterium]|nr:hypothetical protein [Myxococcales bacterium]MBL0194864.1 hypothetical protein [Myxococcales bacterium]HQY63601.1 hypothetical protein [Polyangiaceae bacterium]
MQPPYGPHGGPPPPHGQPPYYPGHGQAAQAGPAKGGTGLLVGGGVGCGVAVLLLLLGGVLFAIGTSNRRMREAQPVGAVVVLLAGLPGLVGGGLVLAGIIKRS